MDIRWQHPFTYVVAGPTGCGKTEWTRRFINHLRDLTIPVISKVLWSYGEWQPVYQTFPESVTLVQGLPDIPSYSNEPLLIIIDD